MTWAVRTLVVARPCLIFIQTLFASISFIPWLFLHIVGCKKLEAHAPLVPMIYLLRDSQLKIKPTAVSMVARAIFHVNNLQQVFFFFFSFLGFNHRFLLCYSSYIYIVATALAPPLLPLFSFLFGAVQYKINFLNLFIPFRCCGFLEL